MINLIRQKIVFVFVIVVVMILILILILSIILSSPYVVGTSYVPQTYGSGTLYQRSRYVSRAYSKLRILSYFYNNMRLLNLKNFIVF